MKSPAALHATMVTASGRYVSLLTPRPDDIDPDDIAHHLACTNRFSGAALRPISVAEHSLLCLYIARYVLEIASPTVQLCVLLHDAHEAYLQDDTTPKRQAIAQISVAEHIAHAELRGRFDRVIGMRFGIQGATQAARDQVHRCDLIALATERHHLIADQERDWPALEGIKPALGAGLRDHDDMPWTHWRRAFLDALHEVQLAIKLQREELYGSPATPRP